MRIAWTLGVLFFISLAACGSDPKPATAGAGGGGAGGSGGSGGSGGAADCGGLGCPPCDSMMLNAELCLSGEACVTDAECAATLPGKCEENLGTYTTDFFFAACFSGQCTYHVVSAGCADLTSCGDCLAQGKSQSCAFKGSAAACAECCENYYAAEDYAAIFEACACGAGMPCESACASSVACGGKGPESDACAGCLASTLREGGACVESSGFQSSCINEQGSVFCKKLSQCLATCPAP